MKFIIALALCFMHCALVGQSYYVSSNSLNLRVSPSTESKSIQTLSQYDNVTMLEESGEWFKVKFGDKTGYASKNFLKEGKAITSISSYRIGATCKDGTSSSATGRGACSHHGGVSSWRTKSTKVLLRVDKG